MAKETTEYPHISQTRINPMSQEQKIPIYLINLDRNPDRLAFMSDQLEKLGLDWERFSAVDSQKTTDAQISAEVALSGHKIRMLRGSQCCAISNFEVWRKIANSKFSAAIILQDDVELSSDFAKLAMSDDWIPTNLGLVQLEKWGDKESRKLMDKEFTVTPADGRIIRELYSRTGGAGAYLITKEAAIWALENKGIVDFSIDHILFNMNMSTIARKLRVGMVCPSLATQRQKEFVSTIDCTEGVEKSFKQKILRKWYEVNRLPQQLWLMVSGQAKWLPTSYKDTV